MADHVSLFDRLFSATIAFLLPGLAVLAGAATVTPVIAGWFGAASANPPFGIQLLSSRHAGGEARALHQFG